jgi:arylsulfatase A-like enzyme
VAVREARTSGSGGSGVALNAEEDPENWFYPRDPSFREAIVTRGVIHSRASDRDDPTGRPRWGRVCRQTTEDAGPFTKMRMETIDDETSVAAIDFMKRQQAAGKPFFCWMNSTRMHFRTHVRAEHRDQTGLNSRTEYADGMIEHDNMVGAILKALDDLGLTNDTLVVYGAPLSGDHAYTLRTSPRTSGRSSPSTRSTGACSRTRGSVTSSTRN